MITSNVAKLMARNGKTIRSLARETGLATLTITRARDARIVECRLSTLEVLARSLHCATKDLYEETAYAEVDPGPAYAEAAEDAPRPYAAAPGAQPDIVPPWERSTPPARKK